jgi:amidase
MEASQVLDAARKEKPAGVSAPSPVSFATLASQGIDKDLAKEARKASAMSEPEFEKHVVKMVERTVAAIEGNKEVIREVVDLDRAYASAQLIDDRRARRESLGRLAGIPMTVKDALDVEGLPGSAGIESLRHRRAADAVAVSRARAEGAIIWGKTNTPVKAADWQTYNALYGTTNNPWDLERTPGGSSG